MDARLSCIQALIPIGIEAVSEELQKEFLSLVGARYKHDDNPNTSWGKRSGSVYLLDQKVPVTIPRARNTITGAETPLKSYQKLQEPHKDDEQVFLKLLAGLSTHKYRECAELAPEVFGISASNLSKRFICNAKKNLEKLQTRRLDGYDFVAIFIDGKRYAKDGIVIALGVTIDGGKIILGIEQMNSENSKSVSQFLNKLVDRGLKYDEFILFVVDGSKGITRAIKDTFGKYALLQRCQQHKKENVVSYLAKDLQKTYRIRMAKAYQKTDYSAAKRELISIGKDLEKINPSAAASLAEGLEETLTIHRLGLYTELQRSFTSTNCIESVMSQLGQFTDKVDRWRGGSHIQRWTAAGLVYIEPRLNKVSGWRCLNLLRERMKYELRNQENDASNVPIAQDQEAVLVEA
jgi:transposase-like protein